MTKLSNVEDKKFVPTVIAAMLAVVGALGAYPALAQTATSNLPAMGGGEGEGWKSDVYYENDTHVRGKDNSGSNVGLSKFRNTFQVESDKKLESGWAFHSVLRGTWDGVYRMNDSKFGKNAGSKTAADVRLENTAGPFGPLPGVHAGTTVPFGGGVGFTVVDIIEAGAGLPNLGGPGGGPGINKFVDPVYGPGLTFVAPPASYGSGAGLRVLGDAWHNTNGGVAFAVPVRPCDIDHRGCRDFGGYGDLKTTELEMPEFNSRLDFLREAYFKNTVDVGDGKSAFFKIGRQQVVWGRTDLFRVLDVINPVDYSRNNIYDELQDIRIPQWMVQAEYRMGGSDWMQERNVSVVWNFDKFRANNLGQCGTPNVILDAGCFFRGMANLWDNGGTVANFAGLSAPGTPGPVNGPWYATNFGAHQIGIRNVNLPAWSLGDTPIGVKFEGVTQGGVNFSLNALHSRSQLPSLRAINMDGTVNPFTGGNGNSSPFSGPAAGIPTTHLIAFDVFYPHVNLIGGSADVQSETLGAAFRFEGAFTSGEEFANTARPGLYSSNRVFRGVIGMDRPTFIPFISTTRTTLFSGQLFFQHIFNHEEYSRPGGKIGMPDWENNMIGTLLIKAFLLGDRLSPQLIMARDFKAKANVASPQVDYLFSDNLKFTLGANVKFLDSSKTQDDWKYDDCRSCNPYGPYTTYDQGQTLSPGSWGVGGLEPLGRFRAGPIGAAFKENEAYVSLRYKF